MDAQLTEQEQQHPFEALKNVFENYDLSDIGTDLNNIEQHLFNKSFPYGRNSMEYDNTLHFIENMHKMAQAAYIIYTAYQRGMSMLN